MRSVAIAIFPHVQALDVAGPLDVFEEANAFLSAGEGYELTLVGAEGATVRASNGMRIVPDHSFDEAAGPYDLALVAGGPSLPSGPADDRLSRWLRDVASGCERFGSICTGAFALGEAGLLNGHTVTTHWQNAALLAQRFPSARVEQDRIYCRDGALVTSAGVTAGIDLSLALLAEDHGAALALAVAKRLVVFAQRQGGQSQFSPYLNASSNESSPMAKVQAYVMANLKEDFSVARLAEVAGMSARHFARMFVQWSEVTPHEFIERARVDAARNLLESSDMPLKTLAFECGFASADRMRLVFAKRLRISPAQYRASFNSAGFAGGAPAGEVPA
jgi:transcriptional regulator GlxA family with amidase domain